MVTHATFYGGASEQTLSGDIALKWKSARAQVLDPASTTRVVTLPDATTMPLGGPHFYILNVSGGSGNLTIKDDGGSTLYTVAPNEAIPLSLADNSTSDGVWDGAVRTIATGETLQSNLPGTLPLLYVMGGGEQAPNGPHFSDVNSYEPVANAWSTRTPFPDPNKWNTRTGTIGGIMYIPGGAQAGSVLRDNRQYVKASDSYAILTQTLNPRRRSGGVGVASSKVYFVNGRDNVEDHEDTDEYTPTTDSWAEKTPVPDGGAYNVCVSGHATNSKVYRLEGLQLDGGTPGNYEYDPTGDSWTSKTNNSNDKFDANTFDFSADVHTVGGFGGGALEHRAYNPTGDSWANKANPLTPPTYHANPTTGVISGKGYFAATTTPGGWGQDENQEYDPVGDSWASKAVVPPPLRGNSVGGVV